MIDLEYIVSIIIFTLQILLVVFLLVLFIKYLLENNTLIRRSTSTSTPTTSIPTTSIPTTNIPADTPTTNTPTTNTLTTNTPTTNTPEQIFSVENPREIYPLKLSEMQKSLSKYPNIPDHQYYKIANLLLNDIPTKLQYSNQFNINNHYVPNSIKRQYNTTNIIYPNYIPFYNMISTANDKKNIKFVSSVPQCIDYCNNDENCEGIEYNNILHTCNLLTNNIDSSNFNAVPLNYIDLYMKDLNKKYDFLSFPQSNFTVHNMKGFYDTNMTPMPDIHNKDACLNICDKDANCDVVQYMFEPRDSINCYHSNYKNMNSIEDPTKFGIDMVASTYFKNTDLLQNWTNKIEVPLKNTINLSFMNLPNAVYKNTKIGNYTVIPNSKSLAPVLALDNISFYNCANYCNDMPSCSHFTYDNRIDECRLFTGNYEHEMSNGETTFIK